MMGLGFSPPVTADPSRSNECTLTFKIIEFIKLLNDSQQGDSKHRIVEDLELAILKYAIIFRWVMFTDHWVKEKIDPDSDDTEPPVFENDVFLRLFQNLSPEDIIGILGIMFDKIMINLVQENQSEVIIEQSLALLQVFVEGANTMILL